MIAEPGVEGATMGVILFSTGAYEGNNSEPLPQLILLDLKLPKIDGHEVLKRLRADERTKYIPAVVLTSSTEEKDIISSYDSGVNGFVQTPVDFNEFVEVANHLGVNWLAINQIICPK